MSDVSVVGNVTDGLKLIPHNPHFRHPDPHSHTHNLPGIHSHPPQGPRFSGGGFNMSASGAHHSHMGANFPPTPFTGVEESGPGGAGEGVDVVPDVGRAVVAV